MPIGTFEGGGTLTAGTSVQQDSIEFDAVWWNNNGPNADREILALAVPRDMPYRKIYCAAFTMPAMNTGAYLLDNNSNLNWTLKISNEQQVQDKISFITWDGPGTSFGGTNTQTHYLGGGPTGGIRPQFRVYMRNQAQPFNYGWNAPMVDDGMEAAFRLTQQFPFADGTEWLVSMAPMRHYSKINRIELRADSTGTFNFASSNGVAAAFLAVVSSEQPF